jgi:predicted lipoprotein with Yx(FWY)xxD motif
MKSKLALIGAVAALALAALIPVSLSNASAGSSATVGAQDTKLGRILVEGRGHTLYLFGKDKRGMSSCNGACAVDWPPLIVSGKPRAGVGAKASLLGRTKRKDGRWQVTYNHHPLYTFFEDTKKGQTEGEGLDFFGGEWDAVSPAGAKVEKNGAARSIGGVPSPGYGGY